MTSAEISPPIDDDAAALEALTDGDVHELAAAANAVRAEFHGDTVGYRRSTEPDSAVVFAWSSEDSPATRLAALRQALATPGITAIELVRSDGGASGYGIDDMTTVAWARLVTPGEIHLVAPWCAFGGKLGQVALEFGVDDLGSVKSDDDEAHLLRWVEESGREPARRDA